MKRTLWAGLWSALVVSIVIFSLLTILCIAIEKMWVGVQLLHFDQWSFRVGFAASVLGVAYVLCVRNPNNYLGFYPGVAMSALLAVQFYMNGQYDLMALYALLFIPFQVRSIVSWRKGGDGKAEEPLQPMFLDARRFWLSHAVAAVLLAADYVFVTRYVFCDTLGQHVLVKCLGATIITSSVLANYWMIYKKNDAWISWVIFSLAGVVYYAVLPTANVYLVVLNGVFLVVNGMAQLQWLRLTKEEDMGWIGTMVRK